MSGSRPGAASSGEDNSATQRVAAITQQLTTVTRSAFIASPVPIATAPVKKRTEWKHLPAYKDLRKEQGFPGCAWDVWGRGYDQLGTVNLLTDAVVARSAQEEIKTGHCISLNWPVHLPLQPFFGRKPLSHKQIILPDSTADEHHAAVQQRHDKRGRKVHSNTLDRSSDGKPLSPGSDDHLSFNSQSSTQWDSFRHFGHTNLNCFYNGVPRAEIHDTFNQTQRPHNPNLESPGSPALKLGVHNWAAHGICGRAILLDVWGYLSRKEADRVSRGHHKVGYRFGPYDPCARHEITLDDLKETAAAQGVRFRQGDILLIRMGFTTRYYNSKPSERQRWSSSDPKFAGLECGQRLAGWLWDNHFSAVASDAPALEAWPPRKEFTSLHEQLLTLMGMPIGELFDLEALTKHCIKTRRWTFHFTSWPMNLYGGAASPANAAAYF